MPVAEASNARGRIAALSAEAQGRGGSLRGVGDLSLDPAHDHVSHVAPLVGGESVSTRDLVVALQETAATRRGGVLCDEHGVIAVRRLACPSRGGFARHARGDQIVGVASDRAAARGVRRVRAHDRAGESRRGSAALRERPAVRRSARWMEWVRPTVHSTCLIDRATRRCSRIVSIPSAPGWRPKPQYIATPKSLRYLEAVRCLRSRPETPSIGSTIPRNTRAGPGSRSTSGRRSFGPRCADSAGRRGAASRRCVRNGRRRSWPCALERSSRGPHTSAIRGTCRNTGDIPPAPLRGSAS